MVEEKTPAVRRVAINCASKGSGHRHGHGNIARARAGGVAETNAAREAQLWKCKAARGPGKDAWLRSAPSK